MINSIKKQFILSWDETKYFYRNSPISKFFPESWEMLKFIKYLREKGYDKVFRAGQIAFGLVLSRSLHYGLREEQPSLRFVFVNDGINVYKENIPKPGTREAQQIRVKKLTQEIEKLLKSLELKNIDYLYLLLLSFLLK